jgi:hypothetical protein
MKIESGSDRSAIDTSPLLASVNVKGRPVLKSGIGRVVIVWI